MDSEGLEGWQEIKFTCNFSFMDSEGLEGWEEINMKHISHGFRRAGRMGRN
jgi:hypothetical protein